MKYEELKNEEIILTLSGSKALVVTSLLNKFAILNEFDACLYSAVLTSENIPNHSIKIDSFGNFMKFYHIMMHSFPKILSIDSLSISDTLERLTTSDDKLRQHEDFLYFSYQYNVIMSENPNRSSLHHRPMLSFVSYTNSSKLDDKEKIYNETTEETQAGDILLPKRMSSYVRYTKNALTTSDKDTSFPE